MNSMYKSLNEFKCVLHYLNDPYQIDAFCLQNDSLNIFTDLTNGLRIFTKRLHLIDSTIYLMTL